VDCGLGLLTDSVRVREDGQLSPLDNEDRFGWGEIGTPGTPFMIEDFTFGRKNDKNIDVAPTEPFLENDKIYHLFSHLDKDIFFFKKGVYSNGVWSSGGAKYWYSIDILNTNEEYDLNRSNINGGISRPSEPDYSNIQYNSNPWPFGNMNNKLGMFIDSLQEYLHNPGNTLDKDYYMNLDTPPPPPGGRDKPVDAIDYDLQPFTINEIDSLNKDNNLDYLYRNEILDANFQRTTTLAGVAGTQEFDFSDLLTHRNNIINNINSPLGFPGSDGLIRTIRSCSPESCERDPHLCPEDLCTAPGAQQAPGERYFNQEGNYMHPKLVPPSEPGYKTILRRDEIDTASLHIDGRYYNRITKLYKVILYGPVFKDQGLKLYIPCAG